MSKTPATTLTQKPTAGRKDGVAEQTEHDDRESPEADGVIEGLPPFKARVDDEAHPKCGVKIPPMAKAK